MPVGLNEGEADGLALGAGDGDALGLVDGDELGPSLGADDGDALGARDGELVGELVGASVFSQHGSKRGSAVAKVPFSWRIPGRGQHSSPNPLLAQRGCSAHKPKTTSSASTPRGIKTMATRPAIKVFAATRDCCSRAAFLCLFEPTKFPFRRRARTTVEAMLCVDPCRARLYSRTQPSYAHPVANLRLDYAT